jgi:membrane protein required for colicin V production
MTLDLILLSLVAAFALLGAASGAARQVANLVAVVAAWFSARPVGSALGPSLAPALKVPDGIGIVVAMVVAFIAIAVIVRWIFTLVLRRVLAGGDPESRALDRLLGFVFSGAKVAAVAWVMVCALTFVEDNVRIAGRQLGISPKDSQAFALARKWNVFELTEFAPLRDLAKVAKATGDPKKGPQLKDDEAFQTLRKDRRFRQLMEQKQVRAALAKGDYATLVRSSAVLEFIRDDEAKKRLRTVAARLD